MNKKFSIIIPSFCRKKELLHVLSCINDQTYSYYETIVVDASPKENSLEEEDYRKYDWLTYVPYEREGNVSAQRNHALKISKGDYILFLDDDVDFDKDLLENYAFLFSEYNDVIGINGGMYQPGKEENTPYYSKRKLWHPGELNYQFSDEIVETYVLCSANLCIKRDPLFSVGGFDEQLKGSIDDTDLGFRLRVAGFKTIHHPLPKVTHFKKLSSGSRTHNLKWQYANYFYFQFRHNIKTNRTNFLFSVIWDFCKPSLLWIYPKKLLAIFGAILKGFNEAKKRIEIGPKFLEPN